MTIREKVGLKLIFMALRLVKPWKYDHEYDPMLKDIENLINAEEK